MDTEFVNNVLIIVALLFLAFAVVIMSLSIADSVEMFGDELHDYFEGKEDE